MIKNKIKNWKNLYHSRNDYCTLSRIPFFKIAAKYLPEDKDSILLDIGSGIGKFREFVELQRNFSKFYLLDGNIKTIEFLKTHYNNVILYQAPERLPFEDSIVDYIHCSHLIEHLHFDDVYKLFKELDRILKKGGLLIISTPLLWNHFYDDLSHIKPYNSNIFIKYFCIRTKNRWAESISEDYELLELVNRYCHENEMNSIWGSDYPILDFLIQLLRKILSMFKIYKFKKNGYTIVLQKSNIS